MEKVKIVSARSEVSEIGICVDLVAAEAEFMTDEGQVFFISIAESDGYPNVFKTDVSTIDLHLYEEYDQAEFDKLLDCNIAPGDYDEIFADPDAEYYDAIRYVIYLVRAEQEVADEFMEATIGKYLQDIEIPKSDVEEDYDESLS